MLAAVVPTVVAADAERPAADAAAFPAPETAPEIAGPIIVVPNAHAAAAITKVSKGSVSIDSKVLISPKLKGS